MSVEGRGLHELSKSDDAIREDAVVCKACQFCRRRKIKCDGTRPTCSRCNAQRRPCVYGEDARHSSRASQRTYRRMTEHIASLERTVAALTERHHDEECSSNPDSASGTVSQRPVSHAPASAFSAQTTNINAMVNDENTLSLHGPTSSFRDLLPATIAPDSTGVQRHPDFKLQLIASAALERQKEHAYMMQGNIELDSLDSESASMLFDYFWTYHNVIDHIVYRPAVMHSLATQGIYANKLLLNALYYAGALLCGHVSFMTDPKQPNTLGGKFFERFQELLPMHLETSAIATISALAIMSSTVLSQGKQTLSFLYSGLAQRMAIDLGFNVNPDKVGHSSYSPKLVTYTLTADDVEQQRRVFWALYLQDRFQSLYFGRSPALKLLPSMEPDREVLDTYDEFELWSPASDHLSRNTPYVDQFSRCISARDGLLRLADITNDLISKLYSHRPDDFSDAVPSAMILLKRLDTWLDELPFHLKYEPDRSPLPPPHRLYLHTTYQTLYILLFKPFLPSGHLGSRGLPEHNPAQSCLDAALTIYKLARAYREAFELRHAPFLFIYALFCAATVVPMTFDANPSYLHVHKFFWETFLHLRTCQPYGLRKPIAVIRTMFDRAGIDPVSFQAVRDSNSARDDPDLHPGPHREASGDAGPTHCERSEPEPLPVLPFEIGDELMGFGGEHFESLFGLFGTD